MPSSFQPVYLRAGEEGWDVEYIVAHRISKKGRNQLEFLLHWEGYGSEDDSWEPRSNVEGSLIYEYYKSGDAQQHVNNAS